ncbi:MAG TPA: sigma-70 family RNA polymerase sigma factor [Iamia sp.]|nr:sigma-70 family RNA polymerase sigma factor [Iamia sp.]
MSRTPQLHQGFEAEFPHLLALALRVTTRLLRDRTEAEDAAAEALARTARQWSRVGELPHRDAWVQRVAANVAIDLLRRRRHAPDPAAEAVVDPADPLVGRLEVADLLRGLPARQREVLVLHYLLDLSIDEVATALDISANSVKTHIARAAASLRRTRPGPTQEATVAH